MIPVPQRIPHNPPDDFGDCWNACIASVLEFPYEAVPHFGEFNNIGNTVFHLWLTLLRLRVKYWVVVDDELDEVPKGYSIAVGPSPRFPDMNHCCVALDGKVVFDPHPDNRGLDSIIRYEVIVPIEEGPCQKYC